MALLFLTGVGGRGTCWDSTGGGWEWNKGFQEWVAKAEISAAGRAEKPVGETEGFPGGGGGPSNGDNHERPLHALGSVVLSGQRDS